MTDEAEMRKQLVSLLRGEHSHMGIADAVKDFPANAYNLKPKNVEYSFWHLLEHIRRTQWDVLDFMVNPHYKEMKWPDDYWPKKEDEATPDMWQKTIDDFLIDLGKLETMALDTKLPLFEKIPHGDGQTYYREFIVVGNHNSYHIGEFAILRQVEKLWKK